MSVQIDEMVCVDGQMFEVIITWADVITLAHVEALCPSGRIIGERAAFLHPDDKYNAVIGAREAMRKACAQDPVFKPLFRHFRNRFATNRMAGSPRLYLHCPQWGCQYELCEDIIGDKGGAVPPRTE